jgi:hypothetical protein
MLRPLTSADNEALRTLSHFPQRLSHVNFWWTSGLHEKGAREGGIIQWRTDIPTSWPEAVIQGPHFTVANPFAKQANKVVRGNGDYTAWSLEEMRDSPIPRTNYVRACTESEFKATQPLWKNERAGNYFRVAWRNMTAPPLERGLHAALLLPGPTHVNAVHTMALDGNRETAVVGGLWAALPFDYLVKVSGTSKVNIEFARNFPAPLAHLLTTPLLLRTLRLNCLIRDYAPLWDELFEPAWLTDRWTDPSSPRPPIQAVEPTWSMATPLRTEYDRRMALVEIDALVAVMLGLSAEQLCAMYRSQFAVLRKYEWEMFFAPDGHKIGAATHNVGIRQTPDEASFVKAWVKAARAGDPTPAVPKGWMKPNREAEMSRAHADFTARLHAGEYGDYFAYLAEHPLTTPTPVPESR